MPGKNKTFKPVIVLIILIVLTKLLLSFLPSDAIDMPGYRAWSRHLATRGFDDFYQTWHVVYAPAYLYLLWLSGIIAEFFSLSPRLHEFFIKLWPVLFDLAGGILLYLTARDCGRKRFGLILAAMYALNPAVVFNSSVWGQFESVAATMLFGAVYFFRRRRSVTGVILFVTAVLVKPQSAMLAPVVLLLFLKNFSLRKLWLALAGSACAYLAVVLPFSAGRPVYWVFQHFLTSGGDYPYATANAFNLWTILGGQTVPDHLPFWGLSYAGWSLIFLATATAAVVWFLLRKPVTSGEVYYAAYFYSFAVFMLGSRMHERYLFPALIFLTAALLWEKKLWGPLVILSLCHFANTWYIYARGWRGQVWAPPDDRLALAIAGITLVVFLYSVYYLAGRGWGEKNSTLEAAERGMGA